jgi:hypothetical protein
MPRGHVVAGHFFAYIPLCFSFSPKAGHVFCYVFFSVYKSGLHPAYTIRVESRRDFSTFVANGRPILSVRRGIT